MQPALQGYAAQVVEEAIGGGEGPRLAEDVTAVDRLLGRNAALRSALTDTAVPPAARRGVVLELLEGKASEGSRRLVAFAASAVPAPEFPAAVTWLSHRVRLAAEGGALVEEAGLGHLGARQRVGGYASAIFEALPTDRLEEVEDELFRFARTVDATPALRSALVDRDLPLEARQGVADDLLGGKVQPATLSLVSFVLAGGRARDLVGTLYWLVEQTARTRGWRVARVSAADEVDGDERTRMVASLSRLTGQPVELQVTIDPSLLAGVRVQVGDLQVEASARGRIDELREHISSGAWQEPAHGDAEDGTDAEGAR